VIKFLNNYQVKLQIDTQTLINGGKLHNTCKDLRFTNSEGLTEVNYWIENGCNTASTNIWIKAVLLKFGNNTFYMYHSNSSLNSNSNIKDTRFVNFSPDYRLLSLGIGAKSANTDFYNIYVAKALRPNFTYFVLNEETKS
jgi:hypothetical protein